MLSLFDLENIDKNNNNLEVNNISTNKTNIYENYRNRQPVNSTELTQNSDPLKTNLPLLPILNIHLKRLQRQNSVLFNNEPVILNTSTQPASTNTKNVPSTPKPL